MFKTFSRLTPLALQGFFPFNLDIADKAHYDKFTSEKFEESRKHETGMDRIRAMFIPDEYSDISNELNSVLQSTFFGSFVGACYGGFIRSRNSYVNFIENNQATAFRTTLEAQKKLQDNVSKGFAKGAFQWGWRLGLFTGSYVFITTTIAVYRGKSSIYEYMTAGVVAGSMYKATHGLRGVIVGAGLGLLLGTVGGGASLLILRFSGTSMEEVHYWQSQWRANRNSKSAELLEMSAKEKKDPLLEEREARLDSKHLTLETSKLV